VNPTSDVDLACQPTDEPIGMYQVGRLGRRSKISSIDQIAVALELAT